jgi:hypothetical protein
VISFEYLDKIELVYILKPLTVETNFPNQSMANFWLRRSLCQSMLNRIVFYFQLCPTQYSRGHGFMTTMFSFSRSSANEGRKKQHEKSCAHGENFSPR